MCVFFFSVFPVIDVVFAVGGSGGGHSRAALETLARAAALAHNLDLLGVARAVVADQLEAALLGASRTTAIGAAVAAAHRVTHRFGRATAVLHVVVAVLLFAARWSCRTNSHASVSSVNGFLV